jgi:myo-inositol-1-phosphate synthase
MEGEKFGSIPLVVDLRLSVEDSPNSAGIVIDAIRCIKLALDRNLKGALLAPSAYFMKHPYKQMNDQDAYKELRKFIETV